MLEDERDSDEDDPVRGQDPQGAVPEVLPHRRHGPAPKGRRDEDPVQQEPAEHEEKRHAGAEIVDDLRQRAEIDWAPVGGPVVVHVVEEHAYRGDRANTFDARKPRGLSLPFAFHRPPDSLRP